MLARGARVRRDPDPDALLPRGVLGRLRDEPALRAQDAVRARALPARPPLGAPAPPRRMDRAVRATSRAILLAALAIRVAWVLATPDYQLVHDALDYDRHAASIAAGDGFAPPTGARPRSARPPIRSSWPASTCSRASRTGAAGRGRADRQRVRRHRDRGADRPARVPALGAARGAGRDGARRGLRAADPRRAVGDVRAAVRALHARGDRGAALARPLGGARRRADRARDPRPRQRDHPARAARVGGLARPGARPPVVLVLAAALDGRAVDDPQRDRARRTSCRSRPSSARRWPAPTTARRAPTRRTRRRGGR